MENEEEEKKEYNFIQLPVLIQCVSYIQTSSTIFSVHVHKCIQISEK